MSVRFLRPQIRDSRPRTETKLTAMNELAKYRPMPSPIKPVLRIISLKVSYLRWEAVISRGEREKPYTGAHKERRRRPRAHNSRSELRGVHQDGPGAVGADAAEESRSALFADDPEHAVKAARIGGHQMGTRNLSENLGNPESAPVLVPEPLFDGLARIRRHPHEHHIRRVPGQSAQSTRHARRRRHLPHG